MTKQKSTKRRLLASALTLIVCVAMLVGTTFAWFTDSVTSSGNIIKSGKLDVEMYWADGTVDPATATWTDASKGAIFNYDLWEPGYVEVRHVKIANVGSLALKYFVNIKANGEVSKLADVIDVYFLDSAAQVTDRTQLLNTYRVGTLSNVLEGTAGTTHGDLTAGESDYITIALKMQESAGNEYQNLSIGTDFSVQVLATQYTYEDDSFDELYDEDAVTYVKYDSTLTAAENGTVLKNVLAAAEEGDIILLSAGNWYATQYKQYKLTADNVTVVGENGAVLGFETENKNSILDVYGDNVVIKNIEFNKNKQEFNQCILAVGAENLTVDGCTFYGENYKGGNTPTMGIYIYENFDSSSVEAQDAVTKYTITNNSFLGAAVGSYKGGKTKVTTDPGVSAATVSEDLVIKNNTFVGANILIENWRSWSLEANRDHKFVPTITGNNFVSPNLCFANTPHSIYLRCYRQGDPDKILPEGYIDAFVANNTIATPSNDTIVTYNDTKYMLSNDYGTFYRDNNTYGIIAYCYGQTFVNAVTSAEDLTTALAAGEDVALAADVTFDTDVALSVADGASASIDLNGYTLEGSSEATGKNRNLFTVKGDLTVSNGTVEMEHIGDDMGWSNLVSAFSVEGGTLTLNGVTINTSGSSMAYGVDVNTTLGETVLNINDSYITSSYTAVRIFNNHKTATGTVNLNSGVVSGTSRDIWVHNPSAAAVDANGIVNIAGGYTYTTTVQDNFFNSRIYQID